MTVETRHLEAPHTLLFDWHGTLADTHDAMFSAMEEMLPQLEDLGLVERLLPEADCATSDDARLVRYIRIFRRLHPRILAERRVSRTDIFNAIFGDDRNVKRVAHEAYNACYRRHFGEVKPYQQGVRAYLEAIGKLGIRRVIATNRSREFLEKEMELLGWGDLFEAIVCADDLTRYKPDPEMILRAVEKVGVAPDRRVWYVGDGKTDMVTANNAGVAPVFFNGSGWEDDKIRSWFRKPDRPEAILHSFEELMDTLAGLDHQIGVFETRVAEVRPEPYPAPKPPEPRQEADWHPAVAKLIRPRVILFDWHATLVDTLDAMYHAVDDMLPEFDSLGLTEQMMTPEDSKTPEDARLVEYVREFARLHPKVRADRKISRTDIFEVLFGEDQAAKKVAHEAFNRHYRTHYGEVKSFEPKVSQMLASLRNLGIQVGVITNRDSEFFHHELDCVEDTGWRHLFDTTVCGDDVEHRKPHPDQLLLAAEKLHYPADPSVWYVGDSTTDIIAAKTAGMTAVFFNGAQWDLPWLEKIFPGTHRHPHKPDVVVNDFSEFWALVLACEVGPAG